RIQNVLEQRRRRRRRGRCAVEGDEQISAVGATAEGADRDTAEQHVAAAHTDLARARALVLDRQLIGCRAVRRERNLQRPAIEVWLGSTACSGCRRYRLGAGV